MKKVSELTGAELDYWVAKAEGMDADVVVPGGFSPSKRWHDGGPIIERHMLNVYWVPHNSSTDPGHWEVFIRAYDEDGFTGPTTLIAAMRAYVASKYGNTVPAEVQL